MMNEGNEMIPTVNDLWLERVQALHAKLDAISKIANSDPTVHIAEIQLRTIREILNEK